MLILQGMGEFRASLISSATAYHPEPERERQGERSERERGWGWERKWENWGKGSGRLETGRRRGENHQSINTQMRTASHPKRNSGTIKKNPQTSRRGAEHEVMKWMISHCHLGPPLLHLHPYSSFSPCLSLIFCSCHSFILHVLISRFPAFPLLDMDLGSFSENPKGEADAVRQGHFTFFDVFTYELRPDNGTT